MSDSERSNHRRDDRIVEVYRASDNIHAKLIVAALEAAGIKARIAGEFSEGGRAEIVGWDASPQILVFESDCQRARTIIDDAERSRKSRATSDDG